MRRALLVLGHGRLEEAARLVRPPPEELQLKFWMLFVAALDFAVAGLVALALKQRALPLTSIGGLLAIGVFIAGGLVRVVAGALIHLNPDGRGGYALASGAMCVESFVGIALSGEALSSLPYAIPLANFYFTLLLSLIHI